MPKARNMGFSHDTSESIASVHMISKQPIRKQQKANNILINLFIQFKRGDYFKSCKYDAH
jgi:hypothetical protein